MSLINNSAVNSLSNAMTGLKLFGIKIFMLYVVAGFLIWQIESSLHRVVNRINESKGNAVSKVYLKGLVQNPEIFWRTSQLHLEHGDVDKAVYDLELAIGLLEVNNAPDHVMDKYKRKISELSR